MTPPITSMRYEGAWSAATRYGFGDVVTEAGGTYCCVQGNVNNVPPNVTFWQAIASGAAPGSVWRVGSGVPGNGLGVNGDQYLDSDDGKVYSKAAGVYTLTADIHGTPVWMGPWDGGTVYHLGDAVSDGGSSYVANTTTIAGDEPPSASWDPLALGAGGGGGIVFDAPNAGGTLGITTTGFISLESDDPAGSVGLTTLGAGSTVGITAGGDITSLLSLFSAGDANIHAEGDLNLTAVGAITANGVPVGGGFTTLIDTTGIVLSAAFQSLTPLDVALVNGHTYLLRLAFRAILITLNRTITTRLVLPAGSDGAGYLLVPDGSTASAPNLGIGGSGVAAIDAVFTPATGQSPSLYKLEAVVTAGASGPFHVQVETDFVQAAEITNAVLEILDLS